MPDTTPFEAIPFDPDPLAPSIPVDHPRETCGECGRPRADQHDEAACDTGACGCPTARSLCWWDWNGKKCLPFSLRSTARRCAARERIP